MSELATPTGRPKRRLSRGRKLALALIAWCLLAAAAYCGWTVYRGHGLYESLKTPGRGWSASPCRPDDELGFAYIPGIECEELLPLGPGVPMKLDEDGFRVVPGGDPQGPRPRPHVLFLGCSFTYGAVTAAEETFPHLTAQQLGGTALNAGGSSYGLAQMVLLGRKLIPQHQPDVVVAQFSPWLVRRAKSYFADSYLIKNTTPFFYESGAELAIHPPVFLYREPGFRPYREGEKSLGGFAGFFFSAALPQLVHDDLAVAGLGLRVVVGSVPRPEQDRRRIEAAAYGELAELARAQNAKLVILVLGMSSKPVTLAPEVVPAGAVVVQAHAGLVERLAKKNDQHYAVNYCHFRGDPLRLVDPHPNPRAHRLIADQLVEALRSGQGAGDDDD